MWVAKFKIKDDEDIFTPLCAKYKVEFFAHPYSVFEKQNKINLFVGGLISGAEKDKNNWLKEVKKDKRVKSVEQYHDFILFYIQHPLSREIKAEIKIFYNPEFIRVKPVFLNVDGWETWEVACLDRLQLNNLINTAEKYYHGELVYVRKENLKDIASLEFAPSLTEKQFEALKLAYKEGYYNYPRRKTLPQLAGSIKKSYSTFHENLSKAENKLIDYFLKYR